MKKILALDIRGEYGGDFVIIKGNTVTLIGDVIELRLNAKPDFISIVDKSSTQYFWEFPVTVFLSTELTPFDIEFRVANGWISKHCMICLKIGEIQTVVSTPSNDGYNIIYVPKIDGFIPGLHGPVKA